MSGKSFSRALAVTTVASLVMASTAFADNTIADGDSATPVDNNNMVFGNVSCNVPASKTSLIAISRNGSATGTNTFANNAQVTVSVVSVSGAGLSATIDPAANQITLPSAWTSLTNNVMSSGTVSAAVSLTSTAAGAGTGTVNFRATGLNTAGATINRDDAMAVSWTTGSCAPPNTAPGVSVFGVTSGGNYEIGSVPAATCDVIDTEDGNSSFAATLSDITGSLSAYGLGSQTASCSYTDDGGLSDSDSATYTIVDTAIPVITDEGPTTTPNAAGWYSSAVTNEFGASDSGAGFESPLTNPYTFSKESGTAEGEDIKINSGTVTDAAGNEANAIDSAEFDIDLSDPVNVQFSIFGSSHYFGSVPAAPSCTADDNISGIVDCVVTGYSTGVGSHELIATATDHAGRTATATFPYTVLAWTIAGFYAPVDMNGLTNTVKGGSTVPLKFEVFAGPTELTSTSSVAFAVTRVTCIGGVAEDAIELVTTGGTSLRYDSTGGQFIQNWQTPKAAGVCYRVTMTALDGSSIGAYFKTK